MNVLCVILMAACGVSATSTLSAQGIPRGARVAQWGERTPRLMVANPYVTQAADSAAAVHIGTVVRKRLQDRVRSDFRVVPKEQMNEALTQYGYPADAILNHTLAVTLAKNIQARTVVTGTMHKGDEGRYVVTARLAGVNDEAGNVVTLAQQPGERSPDFGERIADSLEPAAKSLEDAQECMALKDEKPKKAVESAEKAVRRVANHGLARYCLYLVFKRQNASSEAALAHLQAAAAGDPLSFLVVRRLANEYRESNDTANTIATAQQLLEIAPADESIRKSVYRYMIGAGRVAEARDVADQGIEVDPYDADMYDLKANACLRLEDYACVVETLKKMYAVDSTRADTLFFAKISAAALQVEPSDTAEILRWPRLGVKKYPGNTTLLSQLNRAYDRTGYEDSTIAVTRLLITRDTTTMTVTAALRAVQGVTRDEMRLSEVAPFFEFVVRHGERRHQRQLASMLVRPAMRLLQDDTAAGRKQDLPRAIELSRMVLVIGDSASPQAAHYANFALGTALLQQVGKLDQQAEAQKSCDLAKEEQRLLAEAKPALTKVAESGNQRLQVEPYLKAIGGFERRVTAMLKAYCD